MFDTYFEIFEESEKEGLTVTVSEYSRKDPALSPPRFH